MMPMLPTAARCLAMLSACTALLWAQQARAAVIDNQASTFGSTLFPSLGQPLQGRFRTVQLQPAACVDAGFQCPARISARIHREDFQMTRWRTAIHNQMQMQAPIRLQRTPP